MSVLLDTSILVRLANVNDAQRAIAASAVVALHQRKEVLHISPQNLIEFRNVATRSTQVNGLGLSLQDAEDQAADFEKAFPLLEETRAIFPVWKTIVEKLGVIGKQVHDARLVAICHANQVANLMTFNVAHFTRLTAFPAGVQVLDPSTI